MKHRPSQIVPSLQVVTGKGGVGKSTVAAAFALAAAGAGREVLAIEMGEPGGLAGLLGVRPEVHGVPVPAGPGLHITYYDGEIAMAEYLGRFVPWRRMIDAVVSHPLYRAVVSAGPGVRELMAIGQVRDELLGLSTGRPRWDLIVLDAGASGHALQLLGMPAATAGTFMKGLLHRESTRVAGFLADPEQTAIHVVAIPEAMPLEEAASVIDRLRQELHLPIGRLVVNQCRPVAPHGAAEAVTALQKNEHRSPARRILGAAARQALGWLRVQEEGIAALEQRVGLRVQRLPRLTGGNVSRAELERLGQTIFEGMQT